MAMRCALSQSSFPPHQSARSAGGRAAGGFDAASERLNSDKVMRRSAGERFDESLLGMFNRAIGNRLFPVEAAAHIRRRRAFVADPARPFRIGGLGQVCPWID